MVFAIPSFLTLLLFGGLFLAGCGDGDGPAAPAETQSAVFDTGDGKPESLVLGISLYLLVDDDETPDPALSSARDEEGLSEILDGMHAIWSQANGRLELETLATLGVPAAVPSDHHHSSLPSQVSRGGQQPSRFGSTHAATGA